MKRQFESMAMLLIMVFGTLGLMGIPLFPLVSATYVEGPITQDTIWTLADSPLILSNDVAVYSNATLTIEPNVEVRFGGYFSLNVYGSLVANGTRDKRIRFTSSRVEPESGDWDTIRLNGATPSFLVYCIIEYGTSGSTVESGNLVIQGNLVQFNSEIGIEINAGNVTVENNDIVNNTVSGILITDCNQAAVRYNNISSNNDGIILAGHLASEIEIEHNEIFFNSGNGISLESDTFDSTVILNNTISANLNGFHVSTNASTYITRNYISNNSVGIAYTAGTSHRVNFNDIFDNELGMSAAADARINATHNYWGDPSGPCHELLNPYGEGNLVESDGINLDFIFWLTAPIDHINERPTAVLWTDKVIVAPDQRIMFIGADSHDEGRVDQYFFDFDDGNVSSWTTLSVANHTYHDLPYGTHVATLAVLDDFGETSQNVANATITVQDLVPLDVSMVLSNETVNYAEEVAITVYVSNATGPVENASIMMFAVDGGSFNPVSGVTDANGHFTTVFTSPNATEITDVRIIARASMLGYADGADHKYVKVLPPLTVEVPAENYTIRSEAETAVTVKVSLGFRWPIENALIIISCDSGTISPMDDSITDENGTALFTFKAPQTLDQINVAILAIAVREGYAQGQGQTSVTVEPRLLAIATSAAPPIILSEEASTIAVHVTSDGVSVPAVTVGAIADIGEISSLTNQTDANGMASFAFRAPLVTVREGFTANITLTATKTGYIGAETLMTIAVIAKTLIVDFTATTNEAVSEGKVNITVHVTSQQELSPVQEANVTFTSEAGGSFVPAFGLTDSYGNVTLQFTAPQVSEQTVINIIAQASKIGYITGERVFSINMSPGILALNVTALSSVIGSNETIAIAVHVTCNETNVANVSVAISADYGSFLNTTMLTDSDGRAEFVYQAPLTETQLPVVVLVNASKFGYVSADNRADLTVTPAAAPQVGGGLSLTTILLILVPIVIAIVVAVLLKLKIITFASEEEE